jgi:acyl carrier protein
MTMIDVEKCHITHYPASVLGEKAQPVEKIDDNIRRLVEKMADIMVENKGVGLAAPQAGVGLRLFIISLDGTKEKVRAYIIENFLFGETNGFKDNTSFLEEGIIDSTGVLEMVNFLEEEFPITVEDEELIPENLDSINNIEAYLQQKMT